MLLFALIAAGVPAQALDDPPSESEVRWTYGFLPYFSLYASLAPALFLPYDTSKYISAGGLVLGGIPGVVANPRNGWASMGIASACFATSFAFDSLGNPLVDEFLSGPILNIGQKTQMWAYYDGYQTARRQCGDTEYAESIEQVDFVDLLAAPWQPENLARPSVWVPVLAATAVVTTVQLLSGTENSVFATGDAYFGSHRVDPTLGLLATLALSLVNYSFTAIGEEAVFRGIGYEEYRRSFGTAPAMALDSLMFTAIHLPGEIQDGAGLSDLLLNSSLRIGITIGLDVAYDHGGLRASVAQHMWLDVALNLVSYLLTAGVPRQ